MGNFSEGFWNLFLVVVPLASIGALWWFIVAMTTRKPPGEVAQTTGHVWDEDLEELNNPLPAWWRNLFYITLAFGLLYLIFYPGLGNNTMFLGWTQVKQYEEEMERARSKYGPLFAQYADEPIEKLARDAEALRMGERLYASYCTQCHGSDAGGVPGYPSLRDWDWQWGGTPARIEESILVGRNAVMPPWGSVLGEQGVAQVVSYMMTLSGRDADASSAAQGRDHFDRVCAACHQADGTGNTALGAPNLTDDIWLYGGSRDALTATLLEGRSGKMPAHEEFLGAAKVHLLAAYVYSLSPPAAQ